MRKLGKWATLSILSMVVVLPVACAPSPSGLPATSSQQVKAEFKIKSLDLVPSEVTTDQSSTAMVVVENGGGTEGTYDVTLRVDGVALDTKEVTVGPGSTKSSTFEVKRGSPGTYKISVDNLVAELSVKQRAAVTMTVSPTPTSTLATNEVELKHDAGTSAGSSSSGPGWGYSVRFSPPTNPFTIKRVEVFTLVRPGSSDTTSVEIWDSNLKVLYSGSKPASAFTANSDWATFDIPSVSVDGEFRVVFFPNGANLQAGGVFIGYDLNGNKASEVVRTGGIISEWPSAMQATRPKEKTNWMIRAIGTATQP